MSTPTSRPPRRRGCLVRASQILLGLMASAAVGLYAAYYFSSLKERALTSQLPDADRIEVQTLVVHFESITGVVETRELTGAQAQALMHLWHSQPYVYVGDVMCHEPAFRLRFYRHDDLLTEATICFHCHNIYFYKIRGAKPGEERHVIFGSAIGLARNQPPSPALHTFLDNLFPNPKDKSIYHQL